MPPFPSHRHAAAASGREHRDPGSGWASAGDPGAALSPGLILSLDTSKKPNWNETKERATSTPAPAPTRGPKAKEQPRNQSKGPKEGGESLTHGDGGAKQASGAGAAAPGNQGLEQVQASAARLRPVAPGLPCPASLSPGLCRAPGAVQGVQWVRVVLWFPSPSVAPWLARSRSALDEILLLVIAACLPALRVDDGGVGIRGIIRALGLVGQVCAWGGHTQGVWCHGGGGCCHPAPNTKQGRGAEPQGWTMEVMGKSFGFGLQWKSHWDEASWGWSSRLSLSSRARR